MRGFTAHAYLRMKERYPNVLESESEDLVNKIETRLRVDFAKLDSNEKLGRVFISAMMKQTTGDLIKVKLLYHHPDKQIVTILPFKGAYKWEFPVRYKINNGEPNFLWRPYWGA